MIQRQVITIPPRMPSFVHHTLTSPSFILAPALPIASDPPPYGRCESARGQIVCSCGLYALRWDESGLEALFT